MKIELESLSKGLNVSNPPPKYRKGDRFFCKFPDRSTSFVGQILKVESRGDRGWCYTVAFGSNTLVAEESYLEKIFPAE